MSIPTVQAIPGSVAGTNHFTSYEEFYAYMIQQHSGISTDPNGGTFYLTDRPDYIRAIWDTAQKYDMDPITFVTMLQKEQGIVTNPVTSQHQLEWATGCGYTESGTLIQFQGFQNQLDCTANTLQHWMEDFEQNHPNGVTMNIDGQDVFVSDKETYALLKYTPHMNALDLWNEVYRGRIEKLESADLSDPKQIITNELGKLNSSNNSTIYHITEEQVYNLSFGTPALISKCRG